MVSNGQLIEQVTKETLILQYNSWKTTLKEKCFQSCLVLLIFKKCALCFLSLNLCYKNTCVLSVQCLNATRRKNVLLIAFSNWESPTKSVHLPFCYRTTFSEFAAKHAKDSRFKAIEKMKDREALFNEFITAARKKEKEDSKTRGEKVRFLITRVKVEWVRRVGEGQC